MKISKMANIVYRQMPAHRELSQPIPALPRAKAWMQKVPGWGQIFSANHRGCAGGGYG